MNPLYAKTGTEKINQPIVLLLLLISLLGMGYFIASRGMIAVVGLLVLPFAAMFLIATFRNPVVSFFAVYIINFFALGAARYVYDAPFGLGVDIFLVLTYIALFFKYFYTRIEWALARKDVTYVALIWYGYIILEFFNPEVQSRQAWFYFMRTHLYMLLTVVLVFLLFNKNKYLTYFLYLWFAIEMLGTFKALGQLYIGLDPFEKYWLDTVGAKTHLLFGELRAFSFFSDAGQFGASQAHTGMVALIIGLTTSKHGERIFCLIAAFFCFWGMFLSGTRGVWGVLLGAFPLYLILIKNFKGLVVGMVIGMAVFAFFKYTYIGQGIYFINRMRTAFDPENASLQARLINQNKLRPYLASRPFGGGIGHAGGKATRFTPGSFLASVPTDSWYVEIWAEQGLVGLTLHLTLLAYIILKGSYLIMFRIRNKELRFRLTALLSGVLGIIVSSYGNGVYGQMPTGLLVYTSMAFVFMGEELDKELSDQKKLDEENALAEQKALTVQSA
jgi:hypothetical protein